MKEMIFNPFLEPVRKPDSTSIDRVDQSLPDTNSYGCKMVKSRGPFSDRTCSPIPPGPHMPMSPFPPKCNSTE